MKKLWITIQVEWLKTKGLGLVYLAIAIGAIIPLIGFVAGLFRDHNTDAAQLKYPIIETAVQDSLKGFVMFFFLLYIIISANRIAQTDHKNGGWLLMETQPVSKLNIYLAKYINLVIMAFICTVSFLFVTALVVITEYYIYPDPAKILDINFLWLGETLFRIMVSALGIIALQLMISVIIPGFIWPFLLGILGLILNLFSLVQKINIEYSPYNVFYIMSKNNNIRNLNHIISYSEYLSLFWMIVFLIAGYFWYAKKGFRSAFISNKKSLITSIAAVIVFSGIFFAMTKPIIPKANSEFISITGRFETDLKIDSVRIFTKDFHKKIASVPVTDNQFQWKTNQNLPMDEYILEFGNKNYPLVFGKGDWFDLFFRLNPTKMESYVKGNRKAEKDYNTTEEDFAGEFQYQLDNKEFKKPQDFYNKLQNEWQDNVQYLNKFSTSENFGLSDEFKEYRKQLLAIKFLNNIENYKKISGAAAPKALIDELQNTVKNPVRLLKKNSNYLDYKLDQLMAGEVGAEGNDSLIFKKLNTLPSGIEKDRLIGSQLYKSLELKTDSAARNSLYHSEIGYIQDRELKGYLQGKLISLNQSQKGMPFPDLNFTDSAGKAQKLSQFRGKYVIIDLWATWCQPCLEIRPTFEARERSYKYYQNIQFLSISVDQDKKRWENFLKTKPSKTLQWHLPDSNKFATEYGIQGIPRFIILDPQGKIYNMNAPSPNEDNFVEIMNQIKKD
ncbi:redoxin domain-containing protein [Elizabethkingia anophelis]|uniref:thioredoxin-like domain-containing protein n=1 Tax=Elizabethkingia anophelis TaxID=1117645 RepID=UPI0021A3A26E|nr:redoxin domain-containing protein [Elizabethkingia anophelis]MCT3919158.1 redoxin domain-containing protein [Elizabethkingia anophelis]MCT3951513.1 redoxin domain-containing protein [Elizabethkingia anophelis]MCT3955151.1 redoxin domain-containing protein [Elizabethkingia anophelis]MCT3975292.1 redoxin domain-containing protein [Elizabethkingia anophelis]